MGYSGYAAGVPPTGAMEPPEAQTIRSMLHIVRLLCIIFGILWFLGGIVYALAAYAAYTSCTAFAGNLCAGSVGYVLIFPILIIIWGVVDVIIYLQMREIEGMVNQHNYDGAKSKTMIWMILGFVIGGIIIGILLLIAYLKFDPLIAWKRNQMGGAPGFAPTPGFAPPPAAAGAPAPMPVGAAGQKFCSSCGAPNAAGARFCAKCGAPMPS